MSKNAACRVISETLKERTVEIYYNVMKGIEYIVSL
jgi:hypothetical protein